MDVTVHYNPACLPAPAHGDAETISGKEVRGRYLQPAGMLWVGAGQGSAKHSTTTVLSLLLEGSICPWVRGLGASMKRSLLLSAGAPAVQSGFIF